jgi:serine/threonine protein kinase
MNKDVSQQKPDEVAPPVSSFVGPIAELIGQGMLSPPSRPGVLATVDRFEVLRVLGGGGMGVVLLVRDPNTQQDVAIKMIKPDLLANQQVVHRFVKEVGHLQRLRHANVMPVLEVSDRPQGPYFVMPYFERGSLARRIQPGRALENALTLDIASQIAEGLRYAHQRGIIHRDLKPANILLAPSDKACLADFGLARTMFNDTIVDVESQQCEGTAPYMSPAVASGDAEDTRCDIYAFGALLYEMLTGEPPYAGRTTKEIRKQILTGPPKPITALNPKADERLVAVAQGAMARELRDRYANMADILADLERIRGNQLPAGARGIGKKVRGNVQSARRIPKIIVITAYIVGIAIATWLLWPKGRVRTSGSALLSQPVPTQNQLIVSTLAGRAGVMGSADGNGVKALFHLPAGVAVDRTGNLYVADAANNTIRKITTAGEVSVFGGMAGSSGSNDGAGSSARFWTPFGVAVDSAGNVYVADTLNDTIRKITPNGVVSTLAGLAGNAGSNDGIGIHAHFRNPWGVAVDNTGNVYVADTSNNTIRKITPSGVVSTLAGLAGSNGSTDGIGVTARFNSPFALAVDDAGYVYVADTGNNTIRKIAPNGMVSTLAGLPRYVGSADGMGDNSRFWNPQGITVDGAGNVYVADSDNRTIRKITPSGIVSTLAGQSGAPAGYDDGMGSGARFNNPFGIAVDSSGNIYVADANNHTIRIVSNVASSPTPRANLQQPAEQTVPPSSIVPVIVGAKAIQGGTDLSLPPGCQLYVYGMTTGGGSQSSPFAEGQSVHVENASGLTSAVLAVSPASKNSFKTDTAYYAIGGFGVSSFHYVQGFYGGNPGPAAGSVSVRFSLRAPALVAVLGAASSQQSIAFSGFSNLVTDMPSANSGGTVALAIAHVYLEPGEYTIQETTAAVVEGQDPNHQADLIGVFIFSDQASAATSSNPQIPVPGFGSGNVAQSSSPLSAASPHADFSAPTIQTSNMSIIPGAGFAYNTRFGKSWLITTLGGLFTGTFSVPSDGQYDLVVTHLTSYEPSCPGNGYSPVTIRVNSAPVVTDYDPAANHGGTHGMVTDRWPIVAHAGQNTLQWSERTGCTHYWIQRIEIGSKIRGRL